MRKSRASMEPFCDSKFSEYVEYLARVSSEYLTSSVARLVPPKIQKSQKKCAFLHISHSKLYLIC